MRSKTFENARSMVTMALLVSPLLFAVAARAEASDAERAAAQHLFDEARTLMAGGKFPEACAKFEASQQLVPGIGTRFNLADCYERAGRLASAWGNFRSVADASRARGETERAQIAQQRADALGPRLSYVTVTVTHAIPGLVVKRDGVDVPQGAWGTALPLDNGLHHVQATAAGKKSWTTTIDLNRDSANVTVQVPMLEDDSANGPTSPLAQSTPEQPSAATTLPTPAESTRSNNQKIWAIVSGAVGIVGLGIGSGMVRSAEHTYSNADCDSNNLCSRQGAGDRSSAIHRANWSMLPLGIGLAGVGTGLTLWFAKPASGASERAAAGLVVSPNELAVSGRF